MHTEKFEYDGVEMTVKVSDIESLKTVYEVAKSIEASDGSWETLRIGVLRHGQASYEVTAFMEAMHEHPEYGCSVDGTADISLDDDGMFGVSLRDALKILSARTRESMLVEYAHSRMPYMRYREYTELFNAWDKYMALNW